MANPGDKVRFLNEKGEGVVTRIINNIAYVLIEDGFEIPVRADQIVVIEKASKEEKYISMPQETNLVNYNYAEKEELNYNNFAFNENITNPSDEITNDIYLAMVPVNNNFEKLGFYIINDTSSHFIYCSYIKTNESYELIDSNYIEPATKVFLKEFSKEILANVNYFLVQGIIFKENEKGKFVTKEIKIKLLYLLNSNYYKETDFFEEPAFLFSVLKTEEDIEIIKKEKLFIDIQTDKEAAIKKPLTNNKDLLEVDLHIDKIIENYSDLTPSQILNIQIEHFRKKLEECILDNNVKKVVFIHGVGNGTLKLEIRRILNKEYSHYDYQDASFAEYGYGATMVILKK